MREQPFMTNDRGWVGGQWSVNNNNDMLQSIVCLRTSTTTAILGEKLAYSHCEKKEFSSILVRVRVESFLNLILTANMRGFYSHIGPITFVLWFARPACD